MFTHFVCSIFPFDLSQQISDITHGILMLCCLTNDFQLFAGAAHKLSAQGQAERLTNPLGD